MAKVQITYIDDKQGNPVRPPMITEDTNIENQERLFSKIIKEIVFLDKAAKTNISTPVKTITALSDDISDKRLCKELIKRGLTPKAIKNFLKWELEKIEELSK